MEGYLNYAEILDEAMHSLIKNVLEKVAKYGLYGDHHLYISFVTPGDGVGLSKRMRQLYPNEITIVLQHQYTNLQIYDDRFMVDIAFNGISETVIVPFKVITSFSDPGANFVIHTNLAQRNYEKKLDKVLVDIEDEIENRLQDLYLKNLAKPKKEDSLHTPEIIKTSDKTIANTKKPLKGRIISFEEVKAKASKKRNNTKQDA